MRIQINMYFNGEKCGTRPLNVTDFSAADTRNAIAAQVPTGDGWGYRLEMSEEAAAHIGAYEDRDGQMVVNTPELRAFVEVNPAWTEPQVLTSPEERGEKRYRS